MKHGRNIGMSSKKASRRDQGGQALVESLVAMLALAVLWVGLNWLAHYQDISLSATHASRHAAFIATRVHPDGPAGIAHGASVSNAEPGADARPQVGHYFTGEAHRWNDRRGASLLDPATAMQSSWERLQPLSVHAQPGGASPDAATLRRDWSLDDGGVLQASVMLGFGASAEPATAADGPLKLGAFDLPYPSLRRRSHILIGAGHALSDVDTQIRVVASGLAWSSAADSSRAAGGMVAGRAEGVDVAWERHGPTFDWLNPWSGRVPGHLIQDYSGSPHAQSHLRH